ncbi:hypothetical protein PEL8287_01663 [Roseovarius litorisediminis]|uniref:Lipoprotein n=1 Tax=Roseovarius litorisediminis TaxID=1312363 RepID=A0A1Y5S867_9RHOB|nr:hypothetical protein [Roseovarius litorisediminis]SLN34035.1 hypothetical protein PEL8287_01663 [Roseovarius litorisediminis]
MRFFLLVLTSTLVLGACTDKKERVFFDGKYYPAKAKHQSKNDRTFFTATVRKASQGLEGARAAALHAGTQYCVENYGTSQIDWSRAPDDDQSVIVTSNGNVVVAGECKIW